MNNKKSMLAFAAAALALGAVQAHAEEGPWLVRARAVHISPVDKSDPIPALGVGADQVSVSARNVPEIDISYFFTPNWAAELVLTYPQRHSVRVAGNDFGSFRQVPPTLLVQYHFLPSAQISPYVGVGVNYTRISNVDLSGADLDRNSFGFALQAGLDYKLNQKWSLNLDIKKVQIRSDVSLNGTRLTTAKLDPLLVGVGVGYRF
jgi:outer membrane protein